MDHRSRARTRRRGRMAVAALVALGLLAAACGDDGGDAAAPNATGPASGSTAAATSSTTTTLAPVVGGTLTIGQFAGYKNHERVVRAFIHGR